MKNRLDSYLKEHHLLKSRSAAKDLIKRGFVKINQKVVKTPSYIFKEGDFIYYYKNSGLQNQYVLYRKSETTPEEVFWTPTPFQKTEQPHWQE